MKELSDVVTALKRVAKSAQLPEMCCPIQSETLSIEDKARILRHRSGQRLSRDNAQRINLLALRRVLYGALPTVELLQVFGELSAQVIDADEDSWLTQETVDCLFDFVTACPEVTPVHVEDKVTVSVLWRFEPEVFEAATRAGIVAEDDEIVCQFSLGNQNSGEVYAKGGCVIRPNVRQQFTFREEVPRTGTPLLLEVYDSRGMFRVIRMD